LASSSNSIVCSTPTTGTAPAAIGVCLSDLVEQLPRLSGIVAAVGDRSTAASRSSVSEGNTSLPSANDLA